MKLQAIALCALLVSSSAFAGTEPTPEQVQAALTSAASAKLLVSEGFFKTGHWATNNSEAGFSAPADAPAQISIGANGVITIAFDGPSITLTPSDGGQGQVSWSCKGTGFTSNALPAECK